MLVSYIRVTSQINCGDVTILNQKILSLVTTAKSAIDNCFGGIECSGHQITCKKLNNIFVTVNNNFWVTRDVICQWFSLTRENYWQIASLVTQKSLFTVTHALFLICYITNAMAIHGLVMQGARSVTAIISTQLSHTMAALEPGALTHWGWDKMGAIFQMTFLNAFSWMKMYGFHWWYHWNLFLRSELTIFKH